MVILAFSNSSKAPQDYIFRTINLQVLSGFDGAFSNANGTTVHKFDKSSWITRKLDRIRQQTSDTDSIVSRCLVRSHTSVIRRRRRSQGQLGSRTGSGWQAPIYHAGCAEAEKVSVTVESGWSMSRNWKIHATFKYSKPRVASYVRDLRSILHSNILISPPC